jgi:predicted nucleic acid-binding protein
MVCLDTDVIIDFLKEEKYAYDLMLKLKEDEELISTTTINAFELYRGNKKLSDKSNKDSVDIFLNNVKIHDFEIEASKKAAEIFEELKAKGEILELADIMIASIVITKNESLLTRNSKHFERIKELKIEKV